MTAHIVTAQPPAPRTRAPDWRDYLTEAVGTALLLAGGLSAVVLFFAPGSPLPRAIPDENVRRLVTGILFAGTGTAIVYSPLGRRSGGHINPAVTLAFYRLGKMTTRSALWYVALQASGAIVGALAVRLAWGGLATQVRVGVTMPGRGGTLVALAAELVMTGLLVTVILHFVDSPRLMPYPESPPVCWSRCWCSSPRRCPEPASTRPAVWDRPSSPWTSGPCGSTSSLHRSVRCSPWPP